MIPLVIAEDVVVRFPTRTRRVQLQALDRVRFSIVPGETFGVIGESGSGKSTLARVLVGLSPPAQGRVLLDGVDLYELPARQRRRQRRDYQIIFQDPSAALDPRMSVLDSVREPIDIVGSGNRAERTQLALQCSAASG